jgi:hypothetical protein
VISEGRAVDAGVLNAAALPGCHIEVPVGIRRSSLAEKGDCVIRFEAGSGAVIGRMLRGALLLVFHSEALAGVQRLGRLACCLVLVELVGCQSEVPGGNFKPSFLSKELSAMMAGDV